MANLTLTLDDDVLKQARLRAVDNGTSVNAVVRDYLRAYAAGEDRRAEAMKRLVSLSRRTRSGRGGGRWTRDDLHER